MNKNIQCVNSDMISSLPQNIIESILSLMPLRDAVRTSVLSKKWQYCWRSMPRLVFTNNMLKVSSRQLTKYDFVTAIFHVLLLHNGPEILAFNCSVGRYHMESEIAQIFSYLAKGNKLKELTFKSDWLSYKLPLSFFSLQGLKQIYLENCTFELPLTFSGFSQLRILAFRNVEVSASMLQRLLAKRHLLERIHLGGPGGHYKLDFAAGGNKFTFVDLLQCVPLIRLLVISNRYMEYLCADGMPHKLPTSLDHLKDLSLKVCLIKQNEISSALCIIRSSPVLKRINFWMYGNEKLSVQQNSTNFVDSEEYSDLKLDHLEILKIKMVTSNSLLVLEFVKLIMAKSPMLKNVRIDLTENVSFDEELKMFRDLQLPFRRASPSAKLIIKCP